MKTLPPLLLAAALATLVGCGQEDSPPSTSNQPPIDTSCGIDCAAQQHYGLMLGRCFEYTDDPQGAVQNPPALGVKVLQVESLEGGVQSLRVQYSSNGLIRMTDSFTFPNGNLQQVRRVFGTLGSVSYEDSAGALTGVTWLEANASVPSHVTSSVQAEVVGSVQNAGSTQFRADVQAASAAQLTVPARRDESGTELIITESPDHGSDPRRFFVPDVGFVRLFTDFSAQSGSTTEYRLQAIRDSSGGASECGL